MFLLEIRDEVNYTQYDRLLARYCRLSVSVADDMYCGTQGRGKGLKVVPLCSKEGIIIHLLRHFSAGCVV